MYVRLTSPINGRIAVQTHKRTNARIVLAFLHVAFGARDSPVARRTINLHPLLAIPIHATLDIRQMIQARVELSRVDMGVKLLELLLLGRHEGVLGLFYAFFKSRMLPYFSIHEGIELANKGFSLGKVAALGHCIADHERDNAWMFDWKLLDDNPPITSFSKFWAETPLFTSICIDNLASQSKCTVKITVNGQDFYERQVEPGFFVVDELASNPVIRPAYMAAAMHIRRGSVAPRIFVRTSETPDTSYPVYFHGNRFYALENHYFCANHPRKWFFQTHGLIGEQTYEGDLPPVTTVQELREELQQRYRRPQTMPFYQWMPLRDLLVAEPFPDIVSSLLVMNKGNATKTLSLGGFFDHHEYLIQPGLNVFDLFWNEMYHPPWSMFHGLLAATATRNCDIFVRVGWLPPEHAGFPLSVYVTPQRTRPGATIEGLVVYNQNGKFQKRFLSRETQMDLANWRTVAAIGLSIFSRHVLAESRLIDVVSQYIIGASKEK